MKGLRILNFILDMMYAVERVKSVDKMQENTDTIRVLPTCLKKCVSVNSFLKFSKPNCLGM